MNQQSTLGPHPEPGLTAVASPEHLSAIHGPECAAAIWYRQPLPRFQTWIDALPTSQLPCTRTILRLERVAGALDALTQACGTPAGPERDMLVGDIAAMAAIFSEVMRASYLRLRLDVVTNNACRKFHIDALTARLICTYRGTGTQYGISRDGGDPRRIRTVPTGAPMILRGTLWPESPASGLLHRSPPIQGKGETRLVLVLDPVADPESDRDHITIH